jgi:hypothetical protein
MPKHQTARDQRIDRLKKMKGADFALEIAPDFIVLPTTERAATLRVLTALSETINRESAPHAG